MVDVLAALGWGMVSGVVGTTAQTLSERVEQSKTQRKDSMVPAEVGAVLFEPKISNTAQVKQLGLAVHWGHGISMGLFRGALGLTPLGPLAASALHFVLLWFGDVLLYKGLGISPWPWKWGTKAVTTDLAHKFILSGVTSAVFVALFH